MCQLNNKIYAFVNVFKELDDFSFLTDDNRNCELSKFVKRNSFKKFLGNINTSEIIKTFISINFIISMCIVIKTSS